MTTFSTDFGTSYTGRGPGLLWFFQYNVKIGAAVNGWGVILDPEHNGVLASQYLDPGLPNGLGLLKSVSGTGSSGVLCLDYINEFQGFSTDNPYVLKMSMNISLPIATIDSTDNVTGLNIGEDSGAVGFVFCTAPFLQNSELVVAVRNSDGTIKFLWIGALFSMESDPVYTYYDSSLNEPYYPNANFTVYTTNAHLIIYYNDSYITTFNRFQRNLNNPGDENLHVGIFGEEGGNGWLYVDNYFVTDEVTLPEKEQVVNGTVPIDVVDGTSLELLSYFTPTNISNFGSLISDEWRDINIKGLPAGEYLNLYKQPTNYANSTKNDIRAYLDFTGTTNDRIGYVFMSTDDLSPYFYAEFYYDSAAPVGQKIKLVMVLRSEGNGGISSIDQELFTIDIDESTWSESSTQNVYYGTVRIYANYVPSTTTITFQIGLGYNSDPVNSPDHTQAIDISTYLTSASPGKYVGLYGQSSGNSYDLRIGPEDYGTTSKSFNAPSKPSISYTEPSTFTINLTSTDFYDPDVGTHTQTQWQVTTANDENFQSPSVDITTSSDLTSINVVGIEKQKYYLARVRHQDESGNWSEWSDKVGFVTSDFLLFADTEFLIWPSSLPPPSTKSKETIEFRTKITPFETGSESRQSVTGYYRTLWHLKWNVLKPSQLDTMKEFFKSCKGSAYSFIWYDPLSNHAYRMRFASDKFEREIFNAHLSNIEIDLIEVLNYGSVS